MTNYFVTKYGLTHGIVEVAAEAGAIRDDGSRIYVKLNPNDMFPNYYGIGKDAFLSGSEALAAVEKMRKKKIASLQKQLAKVQEQEIRFHRLSKDGDT